MRERTSSARVMMSFGENLDALMKRKNITVAQLSRGIRSSPKTVQEWLGRRGRTPRDLNVIKRLAAYLDCSVHFLLFAEEDPKSLTAEILRKFEIHTGLYEISVRKVTSPQWSDAGKEKQDGDQIHPRVSRSRRME